jgi:hypothetical protein
MLTRALVPLKTSALPNFPAVVQVAFAIVPALPLPERSATVDRFLPRNRRPPRDQWLPRLPLELIRLQV